MEIMHPELQHLDKYFRQFPERLVSCPEINKGMYYFDSSIILHDPTLIYLIPEVQYFIIIHAVLTKKMWDENNTKLIDIYESTDIRAIERAVLTFKGREKIYFVSVLLEYLFKHTYEFNQVRLWNIKQYVPNPFKIERKRKLINTLNFKDGQPDQ